MCIAHFILIYLVFYMLSLCLDPSIFFHTCNDSPEPLGLFFQDYTFQDNALPQMEGLEELHDNIMFYLAIILFAVSWIMLSINYKKAFFSKEYEGNLA